MGAWSADSGRRICNFTIADRGRSICSIAAPRAIGCLSPARICDHNFRPPIGASLPGALVSLAVMGSPARSDSLIALGESLCNFALRSAVAGASMRVQ
jgi:hypothetical protein